jgi:hypothetical protein
MLDVDDARMLLGVSVSFSLPYWVSYSHPTYHFPLVALAGLLAAALIHRSMFVTSTSSRVSLGGRLGLNRCAMVVGCLFAAIQIEWMLMMAQSFDVAIR